MMSNQGQKKIEVGPFDNQSVDSMFKKVRRKSLLRNTVISAVVSVLVFGGGYIGNMLLANERGWDAFLPIEMNKKITDPNVYVAHPQFHYGFLGGTLEYQEYKVIENRVIPWGEHKLEYNVFEGQANPPIGGGSGVQVIEDGQNRYYNDRSGEREMLFYHPSISYKNYINELGLLNQIKDDKYIEMGLSFDKGYTLQQVNQMLPNGIRTTWYWANSYTKSELNILKDVNEPVQGSQVYGFQTYTDRLNPVMKTTEEQFIKDIGVVANSKNSYYNEEAKKLLSTVKAHQKEGMILGVVVTGSKEQLKSLQGLPFIKAATLGATVEKY